MRRRHSVLVVSVIALLLPVSALAQQGGPGAPEATSDASPGSYLVFSPSAHALAAGHGYVQFADMVFPRFQVGVTDRFSVGAATFAFCPRAALLTPKLQIHRGAKTSVAVGVMHLVGFSKFNTGIAYGVSTTDVTDASITVGLGMGYATYRDSHDVPHTARHVMGLIGGEFRKSAHNSIVAEGYIFGPGGMAMVAGRHTWTRVSLDFGLMMPIVSTPALPVPVVNLSWRF
jgi:hypothetical protein